MIIDYYFIILYHYINIVALTLIKFKDHNFRDVNARVQLTCVLSLQIEISCKYIVRILLLYREN